MKWESFDNLPKGYCPCCVCVDRNIGGIPFIASYKSDPESEKGFYSGQVRDMKRVYCTHYIILPGYEPKFDI